MCASGRFEMEQGYSKDKEGQGRRPLREGWRCDGRDGYANLAFLFATASWRAHLANDSSLVNIQMILDA